MSTSLNYPSASTLASSANSRRRDDPGQLTPVAVPINYDADCVTFRSFIESFTEGFGKVGYEHNAPVHGSDNEAATTNGNLTKNNINKYLQMLQEVSNFERTSVTIELEDVLIWGEGADLVDRIMENANHYLALFSTVLDGMLPMATIATDMAQMEVGDVIASHRRARLGDAVIADGESGTEGIPASLLRRFQLFFKPPNKTIPKAVREIKAADVGGMVRLKGIITRVSEVRPLMVVETYTCEKCGEENYQEVTSMQYMPLQVCHSATCRRNNDKGKLVLQMRGSRFQRFQEARIQELTEQVPMGHIPRSMAVVFSGDLTRTVNPGDQVVLDGVFLPKPYTGFKAIKAGLLTDTYLMGQHVQHTKLKYAAAVQGMEEEMQAAVEDLSKDSDVYARLARSIAPEIYGHVDVKKALLLLMIGGVTKEMEDGMRIRGDINICLMGDPGVAKSQLLKYITKMAPRAVYTTGKGSSGVGLTASVTRDPITNEMVLEGGALVLADNGICCIDEFDKMEEGDRTAIHEVMEQQTISISKAGITTTLNARTCILAAANPLHGRYNAKKSPRENINLPPALLSRFDLLFLILDTAGVEEDTRLAEHICQVHRTGEAPQSAFDDGVTIEVFRSYIATARTYNPIVPQSLVEYVVGAYVGLRLNDLQQKDTTYTTPRTLLAVLRLSQALARIRFNNVVTQSDIDEAMRLMDVSRSSVDVHLAKSSRPTQNDPVTRILALIRDLAQKDFNSVEEGVPVLGMDVVRETVRSAGFNEEQLSACLRAFDQCNIWSLSPDGTTLKIFN